VPEAVQEGGAELEDLLDRRLAEVEDPVVEPGVELGADLVDDPQRERDLRGADDLDRVGQELDAPSRLRRPLDRAVDRDDRFP
jgi:hypothetical protein